MERERDRERQRETERGGEREREYPFAFRFLSRCLSKERVAWRGVEKFISIFSPIFDLNFHFFLQFRLWKTT